MVAERHAGLGGHFEFVSRQREPSTLSSPRLLWPVLPLGSSALALAVQVDGSFVHLLLTSSLEALRRVPWVAVPFESCPWTSVDLGIAAVDRTSQASFLCPG